jgi:sortase A
MENKKEKKKGLLFIIAGLLAIDAALFLAIFNIYQDYKSGQAARIIVEQLDVGGDTAPDDSTDISGDVASDYDYIGILTIPALELELPIISEWDYPALKVAPCRYTGSVYTNDLIILAHNYSTHFGRLKELVIGDEVYFTDMDGNTFAYNVAQKEILKATDVEEMVSGDWPLTLFTCTVGGKSRVTIRCELAH